MSITKKTPLQHSYFKYNMLMDFKILMNKISKLTFKINLLIYLLDIISLTRTLKSQKLTFNQILNLTDCFKI